MIGFPSGISSTSFERRRPFPFYADRGMVAAAHPLVVEAGVFVLRTGGNAFDAAVASGLAAAVVMPEMCGLGGDLFAVVTNGGEPVAIQSSGRSARNASYELMKEIGGENMPYTGPHSIAVPGMVAGFFELLERFGTKSFAEVAEPAISLARNGHRLQPLGAAVIASQAGVLAQDEAASAIFLQNGDSPKEGDKLVQTDLANTLEQLGREGVASFYSGDIAHRMTDYLAHIGSKMTPEDFQDFEADVTAPYSTTYRGNTVYQTCLPSQGIILLEALNIVEHEEIANPQSADAIHLMVEAKKLAYADRIEHLTDPVYSTPPLEQLLSKAWSDSRYESISPDNALEIAKPGVLQDGDTTYLCTADGEGNMVSLIQSVSSAFGSGVVAGDTGVLLNNRAGRGFSLDPGHRNVYAPGKKTMHTLNCFLVADDEGRPALVGGTPGGDGQPQWNLQMLVGMIDAEMDVLEAIEQPRWTSWPGTDPSTVNNPFELRVECRLPNDIIADLESRGHVVKLRDAWAGGGAAQMIARDPDSGLMIGGSDARVEGVVLGF